jgi:MinD superfamily P-loop ATPase
MVMEGKSKKIAILSGKGGTGKTLLSVNLASVAGKSIYIDCDVEEPNGHLFFKPQKIEEEIITVEIPTINQSQCNSCRKCVDFCHFNAIAFIKNKPYIFEEMCHSCGGCTLICPEKAIKEKEKVIGKVEKGVSENVTVLTGILNTGIASGIPIIKNLFRKGYGSNDLPIFVDCPPGSACIVMESIKDADYCILVAEPTIFGVHNLNMVYHLVKLFKKPYGVILNKCLDGENPAEIFCMNNHLPILGKIPFDNELGMLNSNAQIAVRESKQYKDLFCSLYEAVMKEVQNETTVNS